jgi:nitrite reductase (cytochrome c-552)
MADDTKGGEWYRRRRVIYGLIVVFGILAGVGLIALALDIMEKKQAAKNTFYRVVEITDETVDPQIWGKNFPLQYDDYLKTVDQVRTMYGGSEAVPRAPTEADPRSAVARSKIEADPRLKTMWAGYAFSKDYREKRGHAYMLEDQIYTERQHVVKQPGTCLNCHASVYTTYKKLGDGDLTKGFEKVNQMPYHDAVNLVKHPVACIDCHDPSTMQLRITRPAFMEGIAKLKASQGVANFEVNKMATRQEMRTYVCAQCHVEYYFKGPEKRLTFPWDKGNKATDILAYYEETGFKDWEHAETGAPALKAQHPEFEMYSQGIHARSQVACADCHMPYKRVGSQKISDHHVRSPVLNINRACQTCHHESEAELKARVENIQSNTLSVRDTAMDALMDLIKDLKEARAKVKDPKVLAEAQNYQRKAQFLIDFIQSENSMGFHAPQEAARLMAQSIDYSRKGQVALAKALKSQGIAVNPVADPWLKVGAAKSK